MILILEGEVYAIDSKNNDCEVLKPGDSFGVDACLFGETAYSVITASFTTKIMLIPIQTFFALLNCEKQFTLILGRNLLYKQNIFSALEKFTSYTAEAINFGEVNISDLVKIYKKIGSALHPHIKSINLDISAWNYALQRLPDNLTNTFIYHLTNTMPEILRNDEHISEVNSKARKRTVFKTLSGKSIVILRDMVTDLNDFLSNLCIHYIEAKKLRRKLKSPKVLSTLIEMKNINCLDLPKEELFGIEEIWKEKAVENIRNIILQHEDFKIVITCSSANLKAGPSERWTETLWKGCQRSIGRSFSISEAIKDGLIVDVIQGSTRTLLNLVSPFYLSHRAKIYEWFNNSGIQLKTTEFYQDSDKLFAMAYYYLKNFPEEEKLKRQIEQDAGIVSIEDTEMTGVKVLIVNVGKLNSYDYQPRSPIHLIINIGYTFGKQGYDIIKCFNLLFGNCISSFAFIGKAGGLTGKRKDILISTKFHDMGTTGMTLVNPVGINEKYFMNLGIGVHIGSMLTVAGTILQNKKLLNYYKHIEGCVGLEMEGCYFAQAIQQGIEMLLLKETIPTRFIYYVSDLPLDPNSNLAQEEGNVNWDEGVPTMNAITEQCLRLCFEENINKIPDRLMKFIENHQKIAIIQKDLRFAQILSNRGYAIACFVNNQDELPKLTGDAITIDYDENYEYFLKLEEIACKYKQITQKKIIIIFEDPIENEFWVPVKIRNYNKIRYHTTKVIKKYVNFKNCGPKVVLISNNYTLMTEGLFLILKSSSNGYIEYTENNERAENIEEIFSRLDIFNT